MNFFNRKKKNSTAAAAPPTMGPISFSVSSSGALFGAGFGRRQPSELTPVSTGLLSNPSSKFDSNNTHGNGGGVVTTTTTEVTSPTSGLSPLYSAAGSFFPSGGIDTASTPSNISSNSGSSAASSSSTNSNSNSHSHSKNEDALDDIFALLQRAGKLEEKEQTHVEAATKYYEAVYLMKAYTNRLPISRKNQATRDLLRDKIQQYERRASMLLKQHEQSVRLHPHEDGNERFHSEGEGSECFTDPRSPIQAQQGYFESLEDASTTTVVDNPASSSQSRGLHNFLPAEGTMISDESMSAATTAQTTTSAAQANAKLAAALDYDESGQSDKAIETYMEAASLYLQTLAIVEKYAKELDANLSAESKPSSSEPTSPPLIVHKKSVSFVETTSLTSPVTAVSAGRKRGGGGGGGVIVTNNGSLTSSTSFYTPQQLQAVSDVLKRRLEQTLDRVEQLKQRGRKNQENNGGIVAVQSSSTDSKSTQTACSGTISASKSKASSINAASPSGIQSASASSSSPHAVPGATLTLEEIEILKQSSLITSGLFLPWCDDEARQLCIDTLTHFHPHLLLPKNKNQHSAVGPKPALFTDPDGFLPLSAKQKERFFKWARPSEISAIRQRYYSATKLPAQPVMVRAITPYTIKQQFVTDCSFIASLCICAAFERRFQKRLITSILYPQSAHVDHWLLYNPAGKYMVKLWLNGIARCVVIDDYLPIDKYGNLLCSTSMPLTTGSKSSNAPPVLELWVTLIEKAYMKLCGGYDFPGSNSGVDLFSLTGWIPERILFAADPANVKDHETHPDRAWERMVSASSFGDCLITVSTTHDKMTQEQADRLGLVTGHAYAVLSVVKTSNGTRLLQIKNPWASKGWRGRYSSYDAAAWRDPAFCAEVGYDATRQTQDDGVFWICWDDVLQYFENCHLSWNPALFRYRTNLHGFWPALQGPSDDSFNIGENPQYILTLSSQAIKAKATLWILISRHVNKQEQEGKEVSDFLTVHIHRNKDSKSRIWYPGKSGNCVLTGAYTNNPQVLVRYDVKDSADEYLSLILSQYKKSNDMRYTLSCYCTDPFELSKPEPDLPFMQDISSALCRAGGPIGSRKFASNPMVPISVPQGGALVQLRVSISKMVAVNLVLFPVPTFGDRIEQATGKAVIDTGKYRHGFVVSDRQRIPSGTYVLVVSSFSSDETAPFRLQIGSSVQLKFGQISFQN